MRQSHCIQLRSAQCVVKIMNSCGESNHYVPFLPVTLLQGTFFESIYNFDVVDELICTRVMSRALLWYNNNTNKEKDLLVECDFCILGRIGTSKNKFDEIRKKKKVFKNGPTMEVVKARCRRRKRGLHRYLTKNHAQHVVLGASRHLPAPQCLPHLLFVRLGDNLR